jgi:hypothetical protein
MMSNTVDLFIAKTDKKMRFEVTHIWRPAKRGEWYKVKAPHSTGDRAVQSKVAVTKREVNIIVPLYYIDKLTN